MLFHFARAWFGEWLAGCLARLRGHVQRPAAGDWGPGSIYCRQGCGSGWLRVGVTVDTRRTIDCALAMSEPSQGCRQGFLVANRRRQDMACAFPNPAPATSPHSRCRRQCLNLCPLLGQFTCFRSPPGHGERANRETRAFQGQNKWPLLVTCSTRPTACLSCIWRREPG
ncbi:uncharacterized protein B0I36DRAFT_144470 [Microdochium trichocladiopsis]|uniref:Uncharacterized protein n=1 Tax=Microdochium trichocladiopsis TaxID=1682393 RepID=A0A9P8Y4M9_9PEZI|nr:uncharacterized protein B0I36DRAFT_144470 [Microdochium trichocladiopsis]KAH7027867.1 hypothetical protein B0I36DRAFT_144470 [Microdochium trichocladiopsis]